VNASDVENRLAGLEREVAYLRWLVWRLSLPSLVAQDQKYARWLERSFVEDRHDAGLHSLRWERP
jgi:aminoglycoside phosphotransferase